MVIYLHAADVADDDDDGVVGVKRYTCRVNGAMHSTTIYGYSKRERDRITACNGTAEIVDTKYFYSSLVRHRTIKSYLELGTYL